jgi:hypothetical protein
MRRTLRSLLVVIFLAGQIGAAAHNLLVSHVTCPEHGEVIHSAGAARPEAPQPSETVGRQGNRGHDHDVCLVALHRHESVGPTVGAMFGAAAPILSVALPPANAPLHSAAVYRLAPKTSPPV